MQSVNEVLASNSLFVQLYNGVDISWESSEDSSSHGLHGVTLYVVVSPNIDKDNIWAFYVPCYELLN